MCDWSIASPAVPKPSATRWPGTAERALLGGHDRGGRVAAELDRGGARLLLDGAQPLLPAAVEGGELLVAARGGEPAEVAEQRRDVLDVEHGGADRLVALQQEVGRVVARAREPAADALGGGEAVQADRLGARVELAEQLARLGGATQQHGRGAAAGAVGEPLPVAAELARSGVELAESAVLRAV